jgi:transcriptional regulator with XRE-family HTH domain
MNALDEGTMDRNRIYEMLGGNIRRERDALDLNQSELAKLVGLSRTSVTNVELGRQALSVHQLFDFAAALGVDAAQLLPRPETRAKGEIEPLPADVTQWVASLKSRSAQL